MLMWDIPYTPSVGCHTLSIRSVVVIGRCMCDTRYPHSVSGDMFFGVMYSMHT